MTIDMFEFKIHFEKYMKLVQKEDIYIARNGKIVAKLTNPYQTRINMPDVPSGAQLSDASYEIPRDKILK